MTELENKHLPRNSVERWENDANTLLNTLRKYTIQPLKESEQDDMGYTTHKCLECGATFTLKHESHYIDCVSFKMFFLKDWDPMYW